MSFWAFLGLKKKGKKEEYLQFLIKTFTCDLKSAMEESLISFVYWYVEVKQEKCFHLAYQTAALPRCCSSCNNRLKTSKHSSNEALKKPSKIAWGLCESFVIFEALLCSPEKTSLHNQRKLLRKIRRRIRRNWGGHREVCAPTTMNNFILEKSWSAGVQQWSTRLKLLYRRSWSPEDESHWLEFHCH